MARQERPVDPTAGPLASFAHELRRLRVEAGSPTYRRLAEVAGYSPSTLSAAASGTRQPSLEVVLAYVGACGGDSAWWHQRWLDLDEALRPAAVEHPEPAPTSPVRHNPEPTEPDQPGADATDPDRPDATAPAQPAPEPTDPGRAMGAIRRHKLRRQVLLATVAVAGLTGTAVVVPTVTRTGSETRAEPATPPPSAAVDCPPTTTNAAFTAVTYGSGANVRGEPRRDNRVLSTIPPGCRIGLTGYCLGEKIIDATSATPDIRWFTLADGGLVASGVVHGNPPPGLGPSRCVGDRPGPASITVTTATEASAPDRLRLSATGTHVEIVGFAAYYADDPTLPTERRWHQIALTGTAAPAFDVTWMVDRLPARPAPTDEIPVAAVACLGGGAPTDVLDVKMARTNGTSSPATLPLAPDDRLAARRSACLYP